MLTRKEIHRPEHNRYLYDNGCLLCDTIEAIHAYANGTAVYPPWIDTEAKQEADAIEDIRRVYKAHGISPG